MGSVRYWKVLCTISILMSLSSMTQDERMAKGMDDEAEITKLDY